MATCYATSAHLLKGANACLNTKFHLFRRILRMDFNPYIVVVCTGMRAQCTPGRKCIGVLQTIPYTHCTRVWRYNIHPILDMKTELYTVPPHMRVLRYSMNAADALRNDFTSCIGIDVSVEVL